VPANAEIEYASRMRRITAGFFKVDIPFDSASYPEVAFKGRQPCLL
jgi:hypothetical protein